MQIFSVISDSALQVYLKRLEYGKKVYIFFF